MEVLVTLCNRPTYSKQVLDALVPQLEGRRLNIWIDGSNKDIIELAESVPCKNKHISVSKHLGCNGAMLSSINHCFNMGVGELVILEDDCVPAPDFIKWAGWAFKQLDGSVVSFSGYNNIDKSHIAYKRISQDLSGTCILGNWICYGWGLTRALWESSFKQLDSNLFAEGNSWDTEFHNILEKVGKKTLKPWLSRVLNIGREGGTYCPSPEWHDEKVMLSKWAGDPHEVKSFSMGIPHTYNTQEGEDWFSYKDIYLEMVSKFPSGHFVEVGSWKGRSSSFMATEIANCGKNIKFDCVDHWKGGDGQYDPDCYLKFSQNMKHLHGFFNVVRLSSVEAASTYPDSSLDFVFIDGSHDYESIYSDIRAWLPKVKKGGVIAGHDMIWGDNSVARAVLETWNSVTHTQSNCWLKEL